MDGRVSEGFREAVPLEGFSKQSEAVDKEGFPGPAAAAKAGRPKTLAAAREPLTAPVRAGSQLHGAPGQQSAVSGKPEQAAVHGHIPMEQPAAGCVGPGESPMWPSLPLPPPAPCSGRLASSTPSFIPFLTAQACTWHSLPGAEDAGMKNGGRLAGWSKPRPCASSRPRREWPWCGGWGAGGHFGDQDRAGKGGGREDMSFWAEGTAGARAWYDTEAGGQAERLGG